jgi:uncharacterized protein (TIGR02757 family)
MRHTRPVRVTSILHQRLDALVDSFDLTHLTPDPLELVLRYDAPGDQEVAGLLAAAFAYGRADVVVRNLGGVLDAMGPSPQSYLRDEFTRRAARSRFAGFSHRFHKTESLVALLTGMSAVLESHGSLGALFKEVDDPVRSDIGQTLASFVDSVIFSANKRSHFDLATRKSLHYLLSSPKDGSACKRMNLYLRWMVRRTTPDLGLWTFIDPSRLVMPLDTHVHRIATFLGLTDARTANWKAARDLTDRLAEFDPDDPVRYDFAICRLGILDQCSRRRLVENCARCSLLDVCHFPLLEDEVA